MYLELCLPICAIFFSTLLCVIYFSKKRIQLIENNMYSVMLISVLIDSVLVTIEKYLVIGKNISGINPTTIMLVEIMNKLDACLLIIVTTCIFLYVVVITLQYDKNKLKKLLIPTISLNIILYILIFILEVHLIQYDVFISVSGTALYPAYGGCVLFIILSIIVSGFNIKKITKKHIPLLSTIIIFLLLILIFTFNPYITIISAALTFINFLMYFTIENPDVKMLNTVILARDEAQRANRAKSDFLSSMSHEIRTPLNAIVGLSENMTLYKDQIPKELSEDVDDILSSSSTLLEIVGNVLDINKIESDKMEIISVPYNIREELYKVIRVSKTKLGNKPIKFNLDIDENIPDELIGDKVHIKEIINNLLTNAFKYTEQGEVKLEVRCNNQDDKCNLIIIVSDTGRGIKEENINKLFNKFERLDAPINSVVEGTGLGLAITKSLVEMMNGNISVESELGKGSTFRVEIPQQISKLSTQNKIIETINDKEESSNKKIKVLIVDDNKLNIKVARIALKEISDDIDECYDGLECLEKVKNNTYDLILMDIMMPNMDGEETLLELKENKEFNIPVIAVTADASIESQEKYISEGFTEYLSKPFTKEKLKEKIDIVFDRK